VVLVALLANELALGAELGDDLVSMDSALEVGPRAHVVLLEDLHQLVVLLEIGEQLGGRGDLAPLEPVLIPTEHALQLLLN